MAAEFAKVLLRDAATEATSDAFLDRITEHLEAMTASELDVLRRQLDDQHDLHVVTAQSLDMARQTKWQEQLSAILVPHIDIQFSQDDSLIAGAEIHFPHAVLRFNWRDSLNDLQRILHQDVNTD
jgi:F-type H+-transporting ATPase subunit b